MKRIGVLARLRRGILKTYILTRVWLKCVFAYDEISSRDCFHPSSKGQDRIAELLWDPEWILQDDNS